MNQNLIYRVVRNLHLDHDVVDAVEANDALDARHDTPLVGAGLADDGHAAVRAAARVAPESRAAYLAHVRQLAYRIGAPLGAVAAQRRRCAQ